MEWVLKCYSAEFPLNATIIELVVKKDIFPNRKLPNVAGLAVSIHYPNQFLKSYENMRHSWPIENDKSATANGMLLKLTIFEATKRRNKYKRPCNEKWEIDDYIVYQQFLAGIKCRPTYHIWNASFEPCNTKAKIALANFPIGKKRNEFKQPCQSAEKVTFEHYPLVIPESHGSPEFLNYSDHSHGSVDFKNKTFQSEMFVFAAKISTDTFKIIVHKEAYDLQNLIGNSGGYIGLILGNIIQMFYCTPKLLI